MHTEIPVDPHVLARVLDTLPADAEPVTMRNAHRHGPDGLTTVHHAVTIHGRTARVPVQRITSALPPHTTGRYRSTATVHAWDATSHGLATILDRPCPSECQTCTPNTHTQETTAP